MSSSPDRRPSREQLQRRLGFLKRTTVVVSAGLFVALATLAAGRTAARGQGSNGTTNTRQPSPQQQDDQGSSGSFWFNPDDSGGGTLGGGSNAAPPAAGTHAS